ncbi:MAG: ankyrin repeat domain-containing protein [Acidobacteria bacterium]|nr:ankyrin repeat domain-containing protein [Acidobacteriota bacterium]
MLVRVFCAAIALSATLFAAEPSPYYLPIRNGDLAALHSLIRTPGPKARDARGNSPLMYAAALGNLESMRLLLEAGADPNAANDFGATPLMWCAGDAAKVRLLLEHGANVNARSRLGRTPLLAAAAYDGATEAASLMIDKGADVNAGDESGMTVLEQAAGVNHIELVRLLIAKGAKVDTVDKGGVSPLIAAAGSGDHAGRLVQLLLDHGANVNRPCADTLDVVKNGPIQLGRVTALHAAAAMGDYESAAALVRAGADVNALDVRKASPLVWAVATDHADPRIVKLLLEKGAARESAAGWARRYRNPAILPLFGLASAKPDDPPAAATPARSVPDAIAKALALSQPTAQKFLETGGCFSCHAQYLNGVAVSTVKPLGLHADYDLEAREARADAALISGLEQQLFQVQDPTTGVDGLEFSLLEMAAAGLPPTMSTDAIVHHIAAMQRKEGDWPNYFEARPPIEDGTFTHTAKGVRVLRLYGSPGRKAEFDERVARAASWLEKAEPSSTEDRAMQILGMVWAGRKAPAACVRQLVARQRPCGGWGQTDDLPADAYATGEALYALHEGGMSPSDPVYRRGVEYLLGTQAADGSWHVVTRSLGFQPYFQSGFPYGHDQWISQAGTSRAVIALGFAR